jgi:hypothetical protein
MMRAAGRAHSRTRRRLALIGALALALSVTAGLAADATAGKKKKKAKSGGTVDITQVVSAPVPDATTTTVGTLTSTIDVGGKKFKRTKIRDVNVTLETIGASAGVPPAGGSLAGLSATVSAPDGATVWLFGVGLFGANLGPLAFDDETPNALQPGEPPARNATAIAAPYQGTAQPYCFFARGGCTLSEMDNGPVSGTWTLRVYDLDATPGSTSIVTKWRIVVQAGRPFLTKR